MISATGTNELLLQIFPLVTQLSGFKVKVTDADGGTVTSEELPETFGVINYSVPFSYWSKAGEMTVQLLSDQGNSAAIVFNVSENFSSENDIQVKFDESTTVFSVTRIVQDKQDFYLNEEFNTGRTWIDGKPVYSKSFSLTSKDGNNHGIDSLDRIIKINAVAYRTNTYGWSDVSQYINVQHSALYISTESWYEISENKPLNITIEYTKK